VVCVVCGAVDNDRCSVWGRCDQLCTTLDSVNPTTHSDAAAAAAAGGRGDDGVRCSCVDGYRLMPDQHTCKADSGLNLFTYLFSPLGKLADRDKYLACVNFFPFLNADKLSQDPLDPFSRSLQYAPNDRYLFEDDRS